MKFEELVVGGCVHALLKSYMDNIPIVLTTHQQPTIDLKFQESLCVEQLRTNRYTECWSMLKFLCAMRGLVVNHNELEYVRIQENNTYFRGTDLKFNKCHLFPSTIVKTDLKVTKTEHQDCYKIIDFMRLKFCDASNLGCVNVKDNFISLIESVGKKELYAVSFLSKEQLTDFDYSDTMVRFITQKVIAEHPGLHRPLIHKSGDSRRIPKIEVTSRQVIPLEEVVYESEKRVKFYDRKKRVNLIKAYRRHCSSVEGEV